MSRLLDGRGRGVLRSLPDVGLSVEPGPGDRRGPRDGLERDRAAFVVEGTQRLDGLGPNEFAAAMPFLLRGLRIERELRPDIASMILIEIHPACSRRTGATGAHDILNREPGRGCQLGPCSLALATRPDRQGTAHGAPEPTAWPRQSRM